MTRRPPVAELLDASAAELEITDPPAERAAITLVALAHATRDQATWGGLGYWDQLAARVLLATYRADSLPGWWEQMCRAMGCGQPSLAADRQTLAATLAYPDPRAVLDTLATHTDAVCLRVRLAWEHHYGARPTPDPDPTNQETLL